MSYSDDQYDNARWLRERALAFSAKFIEPEIIKAMKDAPWLDADDDYEAVAQQFALLLYKAARHYEDDGDNWKNQQKEQDHTDG